jgi:hypothetical protein
MSAQVVTLPPQVVNLPPQVVTISPQITTLPPQITTFSPQAGTLAPDDAHQRLIISNIVVYFYFICALSLSCLGLLYFYCALRRVKFKLSSQLTIHLFLWLICGVSSLIHGLPMLLSLTTGEFNF